MLECDQTKPSSEGEEGLPDDSMDDDVYRAYLDQRNRLLDAEQDLGRSFDKYLLTLSGGALVLSLTFLGDLVTPGQVQAAWLLAISWTLLVLTVFIVGTMMRLSELGHEKYRDILDIECAKGGRKFWERVRARQAERLEPKIVAHLNWWALVTFSIGIGCMLMFALFNLSAKS